MKVGIVCYPVPGGSGAVASELGLALARRGHEVHFISYALPFRLAAYTENFFFHEVEVTEYPLFKYPPYTLTLASKMIEVSHQWKLNVLHVHYAIPHASCAFLAKQVLKQNSPVVITTLHGTDITLVGANKSFFDVTKFSIESSDGVTAVSDFLKRKTISEFDIKKDIRVIPNFVDTNRFSDRKPACQREHFAPGGEKILIHLSNFRPVKRIPDVIEVFRLVRQQIPTKLILIGEGPETGQALSLTHKYRLHSDVIFLGQQEYVENLLCVADLFLLPSTTESFGLAALEALSCGVPVLATRIGGLPELVIDNQNGYLFDVGDTPKMAQVALELLNDSNRLYRLKEGARQTAVEHFDSSRMVPRYESFYQEILKQSE